MCSSRSVGRSSVFVEDGDICSNYPRDVWSLSIRGDRL